MLEKFLSAFLHPDRVASIIDTVNTLDMLGVPDVVAQADAIVMGGDRAGNEGVLAKLEDFIGQAITDAFTQLGVGIEYDPAVLHEHLEFLQFLGTWGTSLGPVPYEAVDLETIYDLEGDELTILREFYALAEGDDVSDLVWMTSVSPYTIRAIDATLKKSVDDDDEEPSALLVTSQLAPMRAFSALHPDAVGVKHVVLTGRFSESLLDLAAIYGAAIGEVPTVHKQAIEWASLGLASNHDRTNLLDDLTNIVGRVNGFTNHTQQVVALIGKIYKELGVI